MDLHLKFFGQLAEITGKYNIQTSMLNDTDALKKKIINDFPKLRDFNFLVSVNKKLIKENVILEPGSEIAFLPPFAGG